MGNSVHELKDSVAIVDGRATFPKLQIDQVQSAPL